MDEKVEVCEWYAEGKIVRKTVNGIDIPLTSLEQEMPVFFQQRIVMTRAEAERIYGDFFKKPLTD